MWWYWVYYSKIYKNRENLLFVYKNLLVFLEKNARKSIPLVYFEDNGYLIKQGYNPCLDYLSIIKYIRSEL